MISALIFSTLRTLVDDRCYPSTFPQPIDVAVWPAIRFTLSADALPVLCGSDDGETDTVTAQIDVVAKSYGAAKTLRAQVVSALDMVTPPAIREFESETYDVETKTHRVILGYTFHASTAAQA